MKTAAETLNPTRVRLTVEVGFDELRADLAGAYKRIGQSVAVPGFRKGKVPTRILDQRVGRGAVLEEAVNGALPKLYAQAVQEEALAPLGRPDIEVTELEDNARFAFTAEVDVRPTLELPDLSGLALVVDSATVADTDVDTALEELRRRFATLSGVDRPAVEGDFVSIDLSAARDGEPLAGVEATGQSYQLGAGTMIEGLDEAVTGLSAGESATFRAPLLGEYAGQDADVTVTVGSVREQVLPALDDEFAGLASEFDSLDRLRTETSERLVRQQGFSQQLQAREKLLDAVLERVDVPLPEAVVTDEVAARRTAIEEQLAGANTDISGYLASRSQSEEDFLAELDTQARAAMRSQFVLDALVKRDGIEVGQEEMSAALVQLAQQSGMHPQQYIQQIVQNNSFGEVIAQIGREKALTALLATATVTDTDGIPVETPVPAVAEDPDSTDHDHTDHDHSADEHSADEHSAEEQGAAEQGAEEQGADERRGDDHEGTADVPDGGPVEAAGAPVADGAADTATEDGEPVATS